MTWTPRSQRSGLKNYDGPFTGVPAHLKPQLLQWLADTLGATADPIRAAETLALRLRIPVQGYGSEDQLVTAAARDEDLLWDVVEGALRLPVRYGLEGDTRERLAMLLNVSGSAYTVMDDNVVDRVGDEAQAVVDAATEPADQASTELGEAWTKAYGRSPDPSDAWDHAIKAVECVLQPVVEPKNGKATLGSIIGALGGDSGNFKSAYVGPHSDHDVRHLIAALRLLWPNPDRHGSGRPQHSPNLSEARAVVGLAAALVQCDREGYLVALR